MHPDEFASPADQYSESCAGVSQPMLLHYTHVTRKTDGKLVNILGEGAVSGFYPVLV